METEKKIAKLFLENSKARTIREISSAIGSDYRITHTAVQRMLGKGVLLSKRIGSSCLCEMNPSYFGVEIYEAENQRKNFLFKNRNLLQLYLELTSKIKTSFFISLVFGSYAKGSADKNSDIDLIFISNERNFESTTHSVLSLLPLKTHSLVFTEEEFIQMRDSKKENVVKEALKNNIILYGVENFYRLKNAG